MARIKSDGECQLCHTQFNKAAITRHLKTCLPRHSQEQNVRTGKLERYFHITVEGYKVYWLHIRVSANSTLADLDAFLRDIWLECCGHLSQFTIADTNYSSSPAADLMGINPIFYDVAEKEMSIKLGDLLEPGMKFTYEYDFGSTTDLELRVMAEGEAKIAKKDAIIILARNNPPEIKCMECQEASATQLCSQCSYDDGWFCADCADEHECGEEMLLPVVNSPRVGVCGYEG